MCTRYYGPLPLLVPPISHSHLKFPLLSRLYLKLLELDDKALTTMGPETRFEMSLLSCLLYLKLVGFHFSLCVCLSAVLGAEPGALLLLGKCCAAKLFS